MSVPDSQRGSALVAASAMSEVGISGGVVGGSVVFMGWISFMGLGLDAFGRVLLLKGY